MKITLALIGFVFRMRAYAGKTSKKTTKKLALQWSTFSPVLAYIRLCVRGVGSITSPVCRVSVNGLAALPSCTLPRWGIAGTQITPPPPPYPPPHLPSPSSAGNRELSKSLFCKPAMYRSIASRVSLTSSKHGVFSVRTTSYLIHWPRNVVMSEMKWEMKLNESRRQKLKYKKGRIIQRYIPTSWTLNKGNR